MDQKHTKTRWTITLLLLLLVLTHLGFAVYYWFHGGLTLEYGVEIRIHQWTKPWLTAMGLWLVLTVVRPGPFLPRRLGRWILDPWSGSRPDRSYLRAWAVLGAMVGSAVGFHLNESYRYLLPHLGLGLPVILALALAGALVHAAYARLVELFARRLARDRSERYAAGLRSGWYVLIWLGLVAGPLTRWEGRFYDPLWPFAAGALAALAAAWVVALSGARRRWVVGAAALAVVAVMAVSAYRYHRSLAGPGPRDRVIFITLDTTRPDHLSAYGYHRRTSPNLDRVASRGVRFTRAVSAMGSTNPSHVSMLSGVYPRTHGAVRNYLPAVAGTPSLAEYFSNLGFHTAAITSRALLDPARNLGLPGFEYSSGPGRTGIEATAPAAFRRAADWLARNRTKNVFIWVHFFDPHMAYRPHPGLERRFGDSDEPCEADSRLDPGERYSDREVQTCVNNYDEEIAYMDQWVGRLLDWVDQLEPKSRRPPLVVIVGDHGEALGEYQDKPEAIGFGHPGTVYEGVIRIPLIISWPGQIPAGEVRPGVVETVDLAPTLVEMVFGNHDFPAQGASLLRYLRDGSGNDGIGFSQKHVLKIDPSNQQRMELLKEHPEVLGDEFAVYDDQRKLVVRPGEKVELYDVDADPLEEHDLSSRPGEQDERLKLTRAWEQWIDQTRFSPSRPAPRDDSVYRYLDALGYLSPDQE